MSAKTAVTQVASAVALSATGALATAPVPTEQHTEGEIYIAVTAAGTTITFTIETSPDGGTTWFPHTVMTAITATGNVLQKLTGNLGKLLRINVSAVTGSFTCSIWVGLKRMDG